MFESLFPSHWTTLKKLMWLKLKGASAVWSTVTGNPVSFTAKAAPLRQLSVAFSPVQDLHGYENPWPAGGGKNKYNPAEAQVGYWVNSTTGAIEAQAGYWVSGFIPVKAGDVLRHNNCGSSRNSFFNADKSQSTYVASPTGPLTAPEDGFFVFVGSTSAVPYDGEATCTINNSDVTFAPYSNLCPILGWDSLTVEQRGKNLWDEEWELGKLDSDGEEVPATNTIRAKHYIKVTAGEKLYVVSASNRYVYGFFYDEHKTKVAISNARNQEVTAPNGAVWYRFSMGSEYGATYNHDISINHPSTETEYVPYTGRSISISLGSTVYSGYVDVVTGQGEVTMAGVDLGTLYWTKYRSFFYATIPDKKIVSSDIVENIICSAYVTGKYSNAYNADKTCVAGYVNQPRITVYDPSFDGKTGAEVQTALSGIMLVYELATPIPISLTPQEVESLAGDNVLFSDANGDLTVEYRSN